MLWVIAIVILMQTARCQVVKTVWQENNNLIAQKNIQMQSAISANETDEFMRLWPQFNELNLQALPGKSFSVKNEPLADLKAKIWFVYHRIDVERFFYMRRHLQELLQEIMVKRNAEAVIKQMQEGEDELSLDMKEQYQRKLEALKLNDTESAIVTEREEALRQLFRLYP